MKISPCLRLRTNLGPRIAFWGPDLGPILVLVLGAIFGPRFGALDFVCNCRGPKRCPKMEPETGTKIGPKSGPQNAIRGPKFVRRRKQGRVEMIFIQRCAGRSYSIVQQTNNFNQRRKGNLGGQNCSNREHEYSHRPNIVKTCFTCRRYTVKSHAWENQQHACYYGGTPMRHRKTACFEALVLEPHFAQSCARFLLLYCLLGWRTSCGRLTDLRNLLGSASRTSSLTH